MLSSKHPFYIFLFISLFILSANAQEFATKITPDIAQNSDFELFDVSDDGNLILFSSNSLDENGSTQASRTQTFYYLQNVEEGTVKRIAPILSGTNSLPRFGQPFLYDNESKVVFYTRIDPTTGSQVDIEQRLFNYDISTESIERVSFTDNDTRANQLSFRTDITNTILVVSIDDEIYFKSAPSASFEKLETNTNANYHIISVGADSSLLLGDQCSQFNCSQYDYFHPNTGVITTYISDTTQNILATMSPDGADVVILERNNLRVIVKSTSDLFETSNVIPLRGSIFSSRFIPVANRGIAVSSDGRYVALQFRMLQTIDAIKSDPFSSTGIFVLDTITEQTALASLYDTFNVIDTSRGLASPTLFAPNSNTLYWSNNTQEAGGYKTRIESSLFDTPTSSPQFNITSLAPLSATINLTREQNTFIKREAQEFNQIDSIFISSSALIEDDRFGLEPGEVTYEIFACNLNWACSVDTTNTQSATILDFENDIAVKTEFSEEEGSNRSRLAIKTELDGAASHYQISIIDGNNSSSTLLIEEGREYTTGYDRDGFAARIRQCVVNFNGRASCSNQSELLLLEPPITQNPERFDIKFLPDFSGIRIRWDRFEDHTYSLFRNGEQLEIDQQQPFIIDTELDFGSQYEYTLVQCFEGRCLTNRQTFLLDRPNRFNSGRLSVRSQEVENTLFIDFSGVLAYEFFNLYRTTDREDEELLTTLEDERDTFVDETVIAPRRYSYRLEGCYAERCDTLASSQRAVTAPLALGNPLLPPSNFIASVDEHFARVTLSWDPVPNATSYRIEYLARTGGGQQIISVDAQTTHYVLNSSVSPNTSFRITSERNDTDIQQQVSSRATELRNVNTFPRFAVTTLEPPQNPQVTFRRIGSSGSTTATFSWDRYPNADYFELLKRRENNFDTIEVMNAGSFIEFTITEDSTELGAGDYAVRACSEFTRTCSEPSSSIMIDFEAVEPIPDPLPTPIATFDRESASFRIALNLPSNVLIRSIGLRAMNKNGNDQRVDSSMQDGVFLFKPRTLEQGDSYQFRYNIQTIEFTTTEFSDFSEPVSIPEGFVTLPSRPRHSSTNTNIIDSQVELQLRFSANRDTVRPVDNVEIFRSTNEGAFELVSTVNAISDSSFVNFSENVPTDVLLTYRARSCNEIGCSGFSQNANVFVTPEPEEPSQAPDTPSNFTIESAGDLGVVTLRSAIPVLTDTIRANFGVEENNLTRRNDFFVRGRNLQRLEGSLNNLDNGQRFFFNLQACNQVGCSEPTETLSIITPDRIASSITLSGEQLRNIDRSNRQISAFSSRNARVRALRGELDTITGEVILERFFHIDDTAQSNVSVFPSVINPSECNTLITHTMPILKRPGSEIGSNNNVERDLFELVYTGSGCQDTPNLEPFSLFLLSPYFNEPFQISDREDWLEQWINISLDFDETGLFTLRRNNQEVVVSDFPVELELFSLTRLSWEVSESSPIRSLSILSGTDAPELISNFEVDQLRTTRPNPRFVRFNFGGPLAPGSLVNIFSEEGKTFTKVSSVDFDDQQTNRQTFVEGLRINEDISFLVQLCVGAQCGPLTESTLLARNHQYAEINRWPSPRASLSRQVGEVNLTFTIQSSPIDNIRLFAISEPSNEEQTILEDTLINILRQDNSRSNEIERVFSNLEPDTSYVFGTEVCNPLGCFISNSTLSIFLPPDSDGDGIHDEADAFPDDPTEDIDTDGDGVGNNTDEDDDGDGISDEAEIAAGLNPTSSFDSLRDLDGDGFTNIAEFISGSEINDASVTPDSIGTFISFEPGDPEFTIEGQHVIRRNTRLFYDGPSAISAGSIESDSVDLILRKSGVLKAGKLSFAYQYASRRSGSFGLSVRINGQQINESKRIQTGIVSIYQANVEEGPAEVEFRFNFSAGNPELLLDGFFIPFQSGFVEGDTNGDGKAELVIRNPDTFLNFTKDIETQEIDRIEFGRGLNDIPIAGDFDGDGRNDIAVRRPSNQHFYVLRSSDNEIIRERFGLRSTDIPVPGDYDGDGVTDFAVRRASDFMWFVKNSSGTSFNSENGDDVQRVRFGLRADDIPVPADYDGDGITDFAVRRPSNQMWFILRSSDGEIERVRFGLQASDIPVPADYDGDGKADIAVRRPTDNMWFILQSSNAEIRRVRFGLRAEDIPVISDYDGDGKADIAVRRPSQLMWFILRSSDSEIIRERFGTQSNYIPLLAPISTRMRMATGDFEVGETLSNSQNDGLEQLIDEMASFEESTTFYSPELMNVADFFDTEKVPVQ